MTNQPTTAWKQASVLHVPLQHQDIGARGEAQKLKPLHQPGKRWKGQLPATAQFLPMEMVA